MGLSITVVINSDLFTHFHWFAHYDQGMVLQMYSNLQDILYADCKEADWYRYRDYTT